MCVQGTFYNCQYYCLQVMFRIVFKIRLKINIGLPMIYIIGFTDMESNIRKLRLEIAFLDLDKNEQCYRLKDFGEVYP